MSCSDYSHEHLNLHYLHLQCFWLWWIPHDPTDHNICSDNSLVLSGNTLWWGVEHSLQMYLSFGFIYWSMWLGYQSVVCLWVNGERMDNDFMWFSIWPSSKIHSHVTHIVSCCDMCNIVLLISAIWFLYRWAKWFLTNNEFWLKNIYLINWIQDSVGLGLESQLLHYFPGLSCCISMVTG